MTTVRIMNSHSVGLELWVPGAVICKSITARPEVLTSEPDHSYLHSKSSSASPFDLEGKPKLMVALKALCDLVPLHPCNLKL